MHQYHVWFHARKDEEPIKGSTQVAHPGDESLGEFMRKATFKLLADYGVQGRQVTASGWFEGATTDSEVVLLTCSPIC